MGVSKVMQGRDGGASDQRGQLMRGSDAGEVEGRVRERRGVEVPQPSLLTHRLLDVLLRHRLRLLLQDWKKEGKVFSSKGENNMILKACNFPLSKTQKNKEFVKIWPI